MTQPVEDEGVSTGTVTAVATVVLVAAELALAKAILSAYGRWLGKVASAIFAVLPINPSIIWSLIPDWNREVSALMRDLARIAEQGWVEAARQLDVPQAKFDITNPLVQDQLRRTRNFMVRTPDEVYMMIIRALDKNAGDQSAQVAAVRNILNVTGTENWQARARTVAVTEVHRAYNFGSLAAAMNVGRGVRKRWNSKDDAATRPAHDIADGQTRPVFQPFTVGGEALLAPGDPNGSPWNVIQCRCKLSYLRSPSAG